MQTIRRVLFVVSIYKPNMGGVETSVESYCKELNKLGIATVILTKRFPLNLPSKARYSSTKVFRVLKPESNLDYKNTLKELLQNDELKADIIHVVGVRRPLPLFALLLSKFFNVPCLMTFVGGDVAPGPIWEEHKEDTINSIQQADAYSAYSSSIINDANNLLTLTKPIPVIKTGINLIKIQKLPTKKLAQKYFLCARRLVYDKGIDILLNAFAIVSTIFPDILLYIAGEGEEEHNLKTLAKTLKIQDKVIFIGTISLEELYTNMKGAIAHICPSRSEGGGNVNIEASACGCVPIGSKIGGIPEYIKDNETGLLFESENINDLSEKMIYLLTNPKDRDQLIKNGLEFAKSFSIETQTIKYLKIYSSITNSKDFKPWSKLTEDLYNEIKNR